MGKEIMLPKLLIDEDEYSNSLLLLNLNYLFDRNLGFLWRKFYACMINFQNVLEIYIFLVIQVLS